MQPLTAFEIASLADSLNSYVHSRLQKVDSGLVGNAEWVSFLFYGEGEEKPLFLSLAPKCPVLLPMRTPSQTKRKTIPALLFLRAHFENHILKKIIHEREEGRVLRLVFSHGGELEIRLFPHGQNLIARVDGKKISTSKVSELKVKATADSPAESVQEILSDKPGRSIETLIESYNQGDRAPVQSEDRRRQQLEQLKSKKQRALELVEKDMSEKRELPHREVGEWLKAHQSLDVPAEYESFVDRSLSFAENLNLVFQKAKQLDEKLLSAQERAAQIRNELEQLERGEWKAPEQKSSPLKKGGAKGRTTELTGGFALFTGKSGEENIKLLRGAQPWDYWLHVKDYPGSHGVIRRNKNEKVGDAVLIEALQHLLKQQFGAKAKTHIGEKFACLVAECRYVKPIKGDRIGRVTYQNERVITIKFSVD